MKMIRISFILLGLGGLFFLCNCSGTPAGTAKNRDTPPFSQNNFQSPEQAENAEGVYIGILSFAGEVTDMTNGTVLFLDEEGRSYLFNALSKYTQSSGSGTSLYYAVHRAIENLSNNASKFPKNISSINLITFTDGLDNNSTSLALPVVEEQDFRGVPTERYKAYIKEQIENRLIAGKPITSFATGVLGHDIEDRESFMASLESLANNPNKNSPDKHFYELSNYNELNQKFQDIANNLTVINRNLTFTVITPSYQPGTKIRMTFDVADNSPQALAKSTRYVEGEVGIKGSDYELINLTYSQGVSSSAETSIPGILNGTEVSYVFPDFVAANVKWEQIKQWNLSPGSSKWQHNSEYTIGDSLKIGVEKRPSVIYLVLDCSRSLSDTDIESIKNAAETFINLLYLKLNPEARDSPGDQGVVMLQNNIWKNDQITSGQFRYYRFHAKPGTYNIRWNDSREGDGTKTCDIIVTIYREDTGDSLCFEKDSGYSYPPLIALSEETDILIEVKGYNLEQGTYSLMYSQQR